ncbi:hypothetical protein ACVWW1_005644 [Bradyrhizobium sp. JR3.5]
MFDCTRTAPADRYGTSEAMMRLALRARSQASMKSRSSPLEVIARCGSSTSVSPVGFLRNAG